MRIGIGGADCSHR